MTLKRRIGWIIQGSIYALLLAATFVCVWAYTQSVRKVQTPDVPSWLPKGFHKTSHEEYKAELKLELEHMREVGMCCDPPITMGFAMYSGGDAGFMDGHAMSPGYYTDGKGNFQNRYTVTLNGKDCEVRREEYDSMWGEDGYLNQKLFEKLAKACLERIIK